MELFLLHSLVLMWTSIGVARRLTPRPSELLLASALLAWGNLVVTSLSLAALHRLGSPAWFLGASAGLALLTWLSALRAGPADSLASASNPEDQAHPWLVGTFVLTIVPLACASAMTAFVYEPNNNDAITHQLPRALYYLGQGNLAHFAAADPRQVYLPFNHSLLSLFGFVYGPALQCLNFFNLAAWGLGGIAVHRLCRLAGSGTNASLVTSWFALAATPVLAQAACTTPELPATVALLGGLVFARRWSTTRQTPQALLAGLGTGLAMGSHPVMLAFAPVALLATVRFGQDRAVPGPFRPWLWSALLAGLVGLPFLLINLAAPGRWLEASFRPVQHLGTSTAAQNIWEGFLPLVHKAAGMLVLNEDVARFGLTGILFLLGAAYGLSGRHRPVVLWAWLGLGWTLATLGVRGWSGTGPRDFLPAVLLAGPCVAAVLELNPLHGRHGRLAAGALLLVLAAAGLWSSWVYLLSNTIRPLAPLLTGSFVPPALGPLPLRLHHRLSSQHLINVDTDSPNESIFRLMALQRNQRFTASQALDPVAYNLLSRPALSRHAGYQSLDHSPVCAVISLPGKRTAGVEFLATIGDGPAARDYYGLEPRAGRPAATDSNSSVLLMLTRSTAATRLRLVGLNPEDRIRLVVEKESADGSALPVAAFANDDDLPVALAPPFTRLVIRALETGTGREIGLAAIPYAPPAPPILQPTDPGLPTNALSLFSTDLVLSGAERLVGSEGLMPTEGPFPQLDLPYIRTMRQPVVRIRITAPPQLASLQFQFSVRPQQRKKAALDVIFNGRPVRQLRLEDQTTWLDQTLDLQPQPGENVLELRDVPLVNELNWLEYLERYPDVKRYLVSSNIPLEEGAREHYEISGRPEGRIMTMMAVPASPPGSYYFVFRRLRLEGFKAP